MPIQCWNVKNAKSFKNFFEGCVELKDITALDKWNVSKEADYDDIIKDTQIENSKAPSWYSKTSCL